MRVRSKMGNARIEYSETGKKSDRVLFSYSAMSVEDTLRTAKELRDELKPQHKHVCVWVDGKKI